MTPDVDEDFEANKYLSFHTNPSINRALIMNAIYNHDNSPIKAQFGQFDYDQYDLNEKWEKQEISGKFKMDQSPLEAAIFWQNYEAVHFFIEQGADPTLLISEAHQNMESLEFTLELVPDAINLHDSNGATILHNAVLFNKPELVKKLLDLGANDSEQIEETQTQKGAYKDLNGFTPLEIAKMLNKEEIIEIITDHNEKINTNIHEIKKSNDFSSTYSFCISSYPTNEEILKVEEDHKNYKINNEFPQSNLDKLFEKPKNGFDASFEEEKMSVDDLKNSEKTQEEFLNTFNFKN